jgi:hypothetical protein
MELSELTSSKIQELMMELRSNLVFPNIDSPEFDKEYDEAWGIYKKIIGYELKEDSYKMGFQHGLRCYEELSMPLWADKDAYDYGFLQGLEAAAQ